MQLTKFTITHKNNVLYDLDFEIMSEKEQTYSGEKNNDYTSFSSIIIGENGSGKSFLLSQISYLLLDYKNIVLFEKSRYSFRRNSFEHLKYDKYELSYKIKDKTFTIVRNNGEYLNEPMNINEFPKKLITISQNIDDKFYYYNSPKTPDEAWYYYGGDRDSTNGIFLGRREKSIINKLIDNNDNLEFNNIISYLLKLFNKDKQIGILYTFNRKFKKNPNFDDIREHIEKLINRRFQNHKLNSYFEKKEITFEVNKLMKVMSEGKIKAILDYTKVNSISNKIDKEEIDLLQIFSEANVLSSKIYFSIENEFFKYDNLSSGEIRMLSTFTKISTAIDNNSLILIDEPETSLHPEWQQKFIPLIYKIYGRKNSHFIIATHSHLMVSDLHPKNSTLTHIYLDEKHKRISQSIEHSTFGWSAENILYSVFNIRTSRNRYFLTEVNNLIELLQNNSEDFEKIVKYINKLTNYKLDSKDPLNDILEIAENYVNKEGKNE